MLSEYLEGRSSQPISWGLIQKRKGLVGTFIEISGMQIALCPNWTLWPWFWQTWRFLGIGRGLGHKSRKWFYGLWDTKVCFCMLTRVICSCGFFQGHLVQMAKSLPIFWLFCLNNSKTMILTPWKCFSGNIHTNFGLTVCCYHVTYEFQSESTVYSLPECQGTPCSKQVPYLKFKWQQRDSNAEPLSS